ncbi:MAG TPA: AAA family ATPase [Streptosporangiaceae bacterium]|nr:AAA family ATPase [Streptosporangiaceae bacterium]
MLLRFEVSNHRSILEPVELSMIAVDEDRPSTRGFDLLAERVLAIAGVYGPNASGKSNVLEALAWLSTAVGRSLRAWDEFIPREPSLRPLPRRRPSSWHPAQSGVAQAFGSGRAGPVIDGTPVRRASLVGAAISL